MKQLSLVFALVFVGLLALLYWLNRVAVDLALTEIFGALFTGVKIVFFTLLVLGTLYGVARATIEIRRHAKVQVIGPDRHGHQKQAIIHRGEVVHLAQSNQQQLDPMQQLAMLKTILQMQGQMQKLAQQTYVDAVPQTQIAPATVTSLPAAIMTFQEMLHAGIVQKALAEGQMILGYVNGQLRYGSWFDLYSCGIGGVSGSGKTTTVRFLLFQAILATGKFVMIDPHIGDPEESLAAQFQMFTNIHALPPCDDEPGKVAKRIRYMFKEYTRRKAKGIKGPALVFVLDEFNEMIRRLPDELRKELADLLLTIAQGGRKFGIFAMIIGQRWSENDLGGKNYGAAIRSSLASVLAHRFTDEDQAKKLIGSKNGAKCLDLEQGHYFFRDTQGRLNETQTPLTEDTDGVAIQSILDDENTLEFEENTPLFEDAENTTEPLLISDFKRETTTENTEMHTLAKEVMGMQAKGDGKGDIIRKVWGVNPGGSDEYKQAVQQYQQVMQFIAERLGA